MISAGLLPAWFYGLMPLMTRRMSILTIWAVATAFAGAVSVWTAYGPVVVVFTRTHGIHLGDLVAAAGAYGGAAFVTDRLLRRVQPAIRRR